jgi:hypothetical protein
MAHRLSVTPAQVAPPFTSAWAKAWACVVPGLPVTVTQVPTAKPTAPALLNKRTARGRKPAGKNIQCAPGARSSVPNILRLRVAMAIQPSADKAAPATNLKAPGGGVFVTNIGSLGAGPANVSRACQPLQGPRARCLAGICLVGPVAMSARLGKVLPNMKQISVGHLCHCFWLRCAYELRRVNSE